MQQSIYVAGPRISHSHSHLHASAYVYKDKMEIYEIEQSTVEGMKKEETRQKMEAAHAQLTNVFIIMPTMLICCCINFKKIFFR